LEKKLSHQSNFQPHVEQVEVVTICVVVRLTQPLIQNVWLNILVMEIVEQLHIQQSIPITNMQPIVEIASTCAYC
jgi:hypothetical protein